MNINQNPFHISIFVLVLWTTASSCTTENVIDETGKLVPKTVVDDTSLPSIYVNNTRLHARAFGPPDSTLVICIHGGPGANFQYLLNCVSLAKKGYRVVFYDQRGSGLSERYTREWYLSHGSNTLDKSFYDDLSGVIKFYKTHTAQKVVLLTQSWGSMLATAYVGKHPNEISGLIVAEPGGLTWGDILEYVGNSRAFNLWSEALNDATYLDQFIGADKNQHVILDYKLMLLSSSNLIVGDVKSSLGLNKMYYPSVRSGAVISTAMFETGDKYKPDFSEGIKQFKPKVLFLYSSNNRAYPDSWAQKISSAYLNKEVIKINDVGHSGMFDQLDVWTNETEPKVLDYLRSI